MHWRKPTAVEAMVEAGGTVELERLAAVFMAGIVDLGVASILGVRILVGRHFSDDH